MPNDLIIRVIGDTKPFERSVARSTQTAKGFETTLKKVAITAEASANTRVAASVRANARLRDEIAAYRSIASAAAKGSREQVAAANLAASAEKRLARSLATTSTEARALSRSTSRFDRDFSRTTRGVLAGSGVFHGLGRSLAFASTSFLGGAGAAFAFKSTIQAAEESQRVLTQTANAVQKSGLSWAKYGKQIQEVALAQSNLSGFDDERLLGTFSNLVRRTGDVTQALKLNALAIDVARGRNIELEAAQALVLKASIGNVGALRRLGINVGKSATAYQALDLLQRKYAGSAAAYGRTATGAQDRFRVAIQNTQEAIGTALLPAITRYLNKGSDWLNQTENQRKIQHDLTETVHTVGDALHDTSAAVKTITGTLGGLKNTLELLLALKVASKLTDWGSAFAGTGTKADTAAGKVAGLRGSLARLGAIGVVTVGVEVIIHRKQVDDTIQGLQDKFTKFQQGGFTNALAKVEAGIANQFPGVHVDWKDLTKSLNGRGGVADQFGSTLRASVAKVAKESSFGIAKPKALDLTGPLGDLAGIVLKKRTGITAAQANTFFDNALARVLVRTGLGTIQQQIAGLQKANALIAQRLKATKDVTRRLNLEDQLLQNAAQIKSLNAQQAADALQKRQDAVSEFIANLQLGVTKAQATAPFDNDIVALKALQAGIKAEIREFGNTADLAGQLFDAQEQLKAAKLSQITAKQFRQLGLTATGDEITPGVPNLKKRLAQLSANISGTTLDTPKLQAQLARFRKVLSEGLVPKDVRAKIRELMDGIAGDLKNRAGNLTKFKEVNTSKFVDALGLNLTAAERKRVRAAVSQVGAGGTVPRQTATDGGFGGQTIVVQHTTKLDGKVLETSTTRHQQKRARRNPPQKRGPNRGPH